MQKRLEVETDSLKILEKELEKSRSDASKANQLNDELNDHNRTLLVKNEQLKETVIEHQDMLKKLELIQKLYNELKNKDLQSKNKIFELENKNLEITNKIIEYGSIFNE